MSDLMDDPRFAKLPKWAREGIEGLARDRTIALRLRDEALLNTKPESTDTAVHAFHGQEFIGLRKGSQVRLAIDGDLNNWDGRYVDVRVVEDKHIELRAGRRISLIPWASNVVHVEVAERW